MALVETNPRYRGLLKGAGLLSVERVLALPAVIISGHPDRNVARVTLGDGPGAVPALLKREHRVRWRDRFLNWWGGFGPVSLARREAGTLRDLQRAGLPCPEWIAAGEDDQGRAFLLVRELTGCVDLRVFLRDHLGSRPRQRRRFARELGRALAAVHEAGFDHPDLCSKHVLVGPCGRAIHFVDWQRARRRPELAWERRCRDLAVLDATLADSLATERERFLCLAAYLSASEAPPPTALVVRSIRHESRRQQRKSRVREVRGAALAPGRQAVVWLDGEALCVTPEFLDELGGRVPDWLPLDAAGEGGDAAEVPLPGGRRGLLVRGRRSVPLRWLWAEFRRRPLVSPELRRAGELFRLQRHGVAAPRLLAFGQRRPRPWRVESFVLTEINPTGLAEG